MLQVKQKHIVQPKLIIGRPGDRYEQEADAMADAVMRMPAGRIQMQPIEEEEMQMQPLEKEKELQMKANTPQAGEGSGYASGAISTQLSATSGRGSVLPSEIQREMSHKMGADFGSVNIHADAKAAAMNRQLGARALTFGSDIYFNTGEYRPQSDRGKHLLAHELTHVVQQQAGNRGIQRFLDDKHNLTSESLSGSPVLEATFDNKAIVGKMAFSFGNHVKKIQEALQALDIELPVFGADKKFGSETENAVKEFQRKAGMSEVEQDGIVGRKTLGLLDRSLRNNRIEKDTDTAASDFKVFDEEKKKQDESCKNKPEEIECTDAKLKGIDQAAAEAIKMIDKVLAEQLPPIKTKKADYPDIFNRIFRNNDNRDISFKIAEVEKIYGDIRSFIKRLKKERELLRCGTECDGGCRSGRPAYHSPTRAGKHIITLCENFESHKDKVLIILHESHHAAVKGSSDKAYAFERLFDKLDHDKALKNAASFHVYAAWVDQPGSQPIGQKVKDVNTVKDKKQKERTDRALAHLEHWFSLVPFDTSETVEGVSEAHQTGTYTDHNPQVFMEVVFSKWFGLTRPPARPTATDVQKIKAIDERMTTMEDAFTDPFVIKENPAESFWERGPGILIELNENVLQLDIHRMIIALLQELVHATPNISAESEPLYVGTVNDMRNLRNLDP